MPPMVDEVPGVGPKPVKDWTDEDVRAVTAGFAARGNVCTYDKLFRLVLQAREEERERASRSRLSLSLAVLREWLAWQWYRWRSPEEGESDIQITVNMARESGGLPDLPAR